MLQAMPRQVRTFIGAVVMLAFVTTYALVAMALAQGKLVQNSPGLVQAAYYVVLGMAWVLPLMPLIKWMERRD